MAGDDAATGAGMTPGAFAATDVLAGDSDDCIAAPSLAAGGVGKGGGAGGNAIAGAETGRVAGRRPMT